jgi:hypothetical protein
MQPNHKRGTQHGYRDEPKINSALAIENQKLHPIQEFIDAPIIEVSNLFIGWYRQETVECWNTDDIDEENQIDGDERYHAVLFQNLRFGEIEGTKSHRGGEIDQKGSDTHA